MADFNVRADAVDVEQIMRQIRARIREKRGVDYTEEQIQELAKVKLEKFLDPKGVRSDLLEQFRQVPVPASPPIYAFDDKTLYESDKAIVRFLRKLFRPLLKLLFNPNTLNHVLHTQTGINRYMVEFTEHRAARDVLFYEVMHNLVVEVTRASIDVKNMKMRVESIASRLEFNERRARALEAVVQYRPESERGRDRDRDQDRERRVPEPRQAAPAAPGAPAGPVDPITGGDSLRTRRKRRRRGRRSGPGFGEAAGTGHAPGGGAQPSGTEFPDEPESGDVEAGPESGSVGENLAPPPAEPSQVHLASPAAEPEARAPRPEAAPEPPSES
jgi:hypothetical protein